MVLDIDVATPEELPIVLRQAVEKFYDSQEELKGAWQDKKAGRIWGKIATIIDRTADSIERMIKKE